jgi:hypothetical protein
MSMSLGNTILLKTISSMAKSYFEKNPNEELKISTKQVAEYIEQNYQEFKVDIERKESDVLIILKKK